MTDMDPARDARLRARLAAIDPALDQARLDRLADRINARVLVPEGGIGAALLPWWKVMVPLAAAAGLAALFTLVRPGSATPDTARSAAALLESLSGGSGERYLAELTTMTFAEGIAGGARGAER